MRDQSATSKIITTGGGKRPEPLLSVREVMDFSYTHQDMGKFYSNIYQSNIQTQFFITQQHTFQVTRSAVLDQVGYFTGFFLPNSPETAVTMFVSLPAYLTNFLQDSCQGFVMLACLLNNKTSPYFLCSQC